MSKDVFYLLKVFILSFFIVYTEIFSQNYTDIFGIIVVSAILTVPLYFIIKIIKKVYFYIDPYIRPKLRVLSFSALFIGCVASFSVAPLLPFLFGNIYDPKSLFAIGLSPLGIIIISSISIFKWLSAIFISLLIFKKVKSWIILFGAGIFLIVFSKFYSWLYPILLNFILGKNSHILAEISYAVTNYLGSEVSYSIGFLLVLIAIMNIPESIIFKNPQDIKAK